MKYANIELMKHGVKELVDNIKGTQSDGKLLTATCMYRGIMVFFMFYRIERLLCNQAFMLAYGS